MVCQDLFREIDQMEEEFLRMWEDVCNIESPTDYKVGVDAVGEYFVSTAQKFGLSSEICAQEVSGNAICITMNGESKERPVCFSGHIDTVHPVGSFGNPAAHRDEEWIYGPGVADCKGGAVAGLYAMAALKKIGFTKRPVKLILQSDEENSSITSQKATVRFMCEQSKNALAFLNTEPGDGDYGTIQRKGIARYVLTVRGKAAHSSLCYKGINAVCEAAHKIIALEKMKDAEGLTCNCGVISGGTVANSVAEECTFLADIRFANEEQYQWADKRVREIAATSYLEGSTCQVTVKSYRCSMERVERNVALLAMMNEIYRENGLPTLRENFANGGSDAADLTAFGIPCVDSLGVGYYGTHSVREKAPLCSLKETAKRLASVAFCLDEK